MISYDDLYYNWPDEIKTAKIGRIKQIATELIEDHHRLRLLVDGLVDFREMKKHDQTMALLKKIEAKLEP